MAGYRGKQSVPGDNLWEIVSATGGTITNSGGYTIHTFTTSGNFQITAARPKNSLANMVAGKPNYAGAEVLIDGLLVAGGGAGGGSSINSGGGGGAGGEVIDFQDKRIQLRFDAMPVVVGEGGVAQALNASATAQRGGYSSFYTWVARGGGGGIRANISTGSMGRLSTGGNTGGDEGGSGSGPHQVYTLPADIQTIGATSYTGGSNTSGAAGGGAGAGANGNNGTATNGGAGGAGVASSISGTSVTYGGGGGGGEDTGDSGGGGAGGAGGGGRGSIDGSVACDAVSGTDGLGGGGGGAGEDNNSGTPGDGGDGVVIIRYKTV